MGILQNMRVEGEVLTSFKTHFREFLVEMGKVVIADGEGFDVLLEEIRHLFAGTDNGENFWAFIAWTDKWAVEVGGKMPPNYPAEAWARIGRMDPDAEAQRAWETAVRVVNVERAAPHLAANGNGRPSMPPPPPPAAPSSGPADHAPTAPRPERPSASVFGADDEEEW